jgi:hypothetical protein
LYNGQTSERHQSEKLKDILCADKIPSITTREPRNIKQTIPARKLEMAKIGPSGKQDMEGEIRHGEGALQRSSQ